MTFTDDEKARISLAFYGPTDNFFDSLFTALKTNQWAQNEKLRSALETPLMRLCAKYLYLEKRRNFALDPVANFHLRNGAAMWRLNWVRNICFFFSSRSLKTREKCISFAQLVLLSLYIF